MRTLGLSTILILTSWLCSASAQAAVKVAASIKPVHALVSAVMGDTGSPDLILTGSTSPHGVTLKPSQQRLIANADVVFHISIDFEGSLKKSLNQRKNQGAAVIALIETPELTLLPIRQDAIWVRDSHSHDDDHGIHDPHIWLDPLNARMMIQHITGTLAKADPGNASAYQSNAEQFAKELDKLNQHIAANLAPVRSRPFIVFHDGYQYFERRFGLNAVGAIAADPDKRPGAKRLRQIRLAIAASKAACVFAEPQFEVSYVTTVIENTTARPAILDPIGITPIMGAAAYINMMSEMAISFSDCLSEKQ